MSFAQPTTVDDLLNYRLNRLLASSGALVTRICEGRYGITRREWRLICILADHGAMSPSQLAERSHLERPRVSRHVSDLVTKKLFARVIDPDDRRRAWVNITPSGRALHAEFFPQSVQLNNLVLSTLSEAERNAFDMAMTKLTDAADALVKSHRLPEKADRRHGGRRRGSVGEFVELPHLGERR
ncbi:MarR family winged helix-turn-helix transcriptional regulator [Ottowia thiooxydans]|uniref:MarR family winged helix-turn-helix transcriptional regulator n=1 Tax=Ottowia thiooxydans TaxID=219182 RepID=UPI0003F8BDB3|nr:MarR family transcriptional regulator [Ottowia thiooxydans]